MPSFPACFAGIDEFEFPRAVAEAETKAARRRERDLTGSGIGAPGVFPFVTTGHAEIESIGLRPGDDTAGAPEFGIPVLGDAERRPDTDGTLQGGERFEFSVQCCPRASRIRVSNGASSEIASS